MILTNANVVENDQILSLNSELLMAGKYWLVWWKDAYNLCCWYEYNIFVLSTAAYRLAIAENIVVYFRDWFALNIGIILSINFDVLNFFRNVYSWAQIKKYVKVRIIVYAFIQQQAILGYSKKSVRTSNLQFIRTISKMHFFFIFNCQHSGKKIK